MIEFLCNAVTPVDYASYQSKSCRTFKLLLDVITVAFITFYHNVKFAMKQRVSEMYLSCDRRLVEVVTYCKSANSAHWLHLHVNTSGQRVSVLSSWSLYLFCCISCLCRDPFTYFFYILPARDIDKKGD